MKYKADEKSLHQHITALQKSNIVLTITKSKTNSQETTEEAKLQTPTFCTVKQ